MVVDVLADVHHTHTHIAVFGSQVLAIKGNTSASLCRTLANNGSGLDYNPGLTRIVWNNSPVAHLSNQIRAIELYESIDISWTHASQHPGPIFQMLPGPTCVQE